MHWCPKLERGCQHGFGVHALVSEVLESECFDGLSVDAPSEVLERGCLRSDAPFTTVSEGWSADVVCSWHGCTMVSEVLERGCNGFGVDSLVSEVLEGGCSHVCTGI